MALQGSIVHHGGRAALRESAAIASLQRYDRRGAAGQHRASRRLCGASRERGHRVAVAIRLPWRCRAASCVRENDYSRRSTWGTSPGRRRRAAAAEKTGGTTTRQRTRCSGTSLGSSCVEGRTRPAAPRTTTVANIVASTSSIRRRSASGPSPSPFSRAGPCDPALFQCVAEASVPLLERGDFDPRHFANLRTRAPSRESSRHWATAPRFSRGSLERPRHGLASSRHRTSRTSCGRTRRRNGRATGLPNCSRPWQGRPRGARESSRRGRSPTWRGRCPSNKDDDDNEGNNTDHPSPRRPPRRSTASRRTSRRRGAWDPSRTRAWP